MIDGYIPTCLRQWGISHPILLEIKTNKFAPPSHFRIEKWGDAKGGASYRNKTSFLVWVKPDPVDKRYKYTPEAIPLASHCTS